MLHFPVLHRKARSMRPLPVVSCLFVLLVTLSIAEAAGPSPKSVALRRSDFPASAKFRQLAGQFASNAQIAAAFHLQASTLTQQGQITTYIARFGRGTPQAGADVTNEVYAFRTARA